MNAKNCPLGFIILTILVASCLPTPPTKSQELVVNTPEAVIITATATRFPTTTPIRAPIPTSTPPPNIIPGHWAEKEDGSFDAGKMFPLVGAINYTHHKSVDWLYQKDLKVVVITTDDVSQMDAASYDDFKNSQKDQLNNNANLQAQLGLVRSQIDQNNLDKYTVVVKNGAIKWVFNQQKDIPIYYSLINGELVKLKKEEEPMLRVPLEFRDGILWSKTEGKQIILTGANLPHFQMGNDANVYDGFLRDIHSLSKTGANSVRIGFDTEYIKDPNYIEHLVDGIRIARILGFRITLALASKNSSEMNEPPDVESGWNKLLQAKLKDGSSVGKVLSNNVDVFSVFSEPALRDRDIGDSWLTWSEWKPTAEKNIDIIRSYIGRTAACFVSGVWWAADARGVIGDFPQRENVGIEIHPYLLATAMSLGGFRDEFFNIPDDQWDSYAVGKIDPAINALEIFIKDASDRRIFIYFGELGFYDPNEYVSKLMNLANRYELSFDFWSWYPGSDPANNEWELITLDGQVKPGTSTDIIDDYFVGIDY